MNNSNKNFRFSKEELYLINQEISKYEKKRASLIEVLKIVQKRYGWISDDAIKEISHVLNISESSIEEVATFYSGIFRKPVGKYIIKYCDSIVCYINEYQKIKKIIESLLCIKPGQTTRNKKFTLLPTCCLGYCHKSPVITINDQIYVNLTSKSIRKIISRYI